MQQRGKYPAAQKLHVNTREEVPPEDEYDDVWPVRMSSSARRYQGLADVRTEVGRTHADVQSLASEGSYRRGNFGGKSTVPPRRSATQTDIPVVQGNRRRPVETDDIPIRRSDHLQLVEGNSKPRFHWLVFVGMAMFTMLVGWVVLTMLSNWWQVTQDDWHYGRPRTFQADTVVGHNDSAASPSHFIAINLNRHVEVIECPGGDCSHALIYLGPTLFGDGQDLTPVTLTFQDANGDGKPDMVIHIQDQRIAFINENGKFRPARPGEVKGIS